MGANTALPILASFLSLSIVINVFFAVTWTWSDFYDSYRPTLHKRATGQEAGWTLSAAEAAEEAALFACNSSGDLSVYTLHSDDDNYTGSPQSGECTDAVPNSDADVERQVLISRNVDGSEETILPGEPSGIVGMHIIYTYANGWQYELYYKNETTIDYRVRTGMVAGRCVKDQQVTIQQLGKGEARYHVSWTEPTGTCVSQVLNLRKQELQTVIFFPQWVHREPSKTVCFQNDNLERMRAYRDQGPAYPIHIVAESGHIHFMEDCGPNDQKIIIYGSNLD